MLAVVVDEGGCWEAIEAARAADGVWDWFWYWGWEAFVEGVGVGVGLVGFGGAGGVVPDWDCRGWELWVRDLDMVRGVARESEALWKRGSAAWRERRNAIVVGVRFGNCGG